MKRFILTIAVIAFTTATVCAQRPILRAMAKSAPAIGYEATQTVTKANTQAQQSSNLTLPMLSLGAVSVDLTTEAKSPLSDHIVNIERMGNLLKHQPVGLKAVPDTEGRECSCGGKLEWTAKAYKEYITCSLCKGTGTYGSETCTNCKGSGKDYEWKSGYVCKSCGKIYKD